MSGEHRMVTRRKDKKGNIIYTVREFNDPKEDSKDIDKITNFTIISSSDLESIMNSIDVRDQNVLSRWGYALEKVMLVICQEMANWILEQRLLK